MNWMEISALAAVGSVLLAIFTGGVVFFFKHVAPNVRHWRQFGKNLIGTPADPRTGQAFAPSIFESMSGFADTLTAQNEVLADLGATLAEVKEQVANTHDTNLRDDVDHVIGRVNDLHAKVDAITTPTQTTTVNVNPGGTQ